MSQNSIQNSGTRMTKIRKELLGLFSVPHSPLSASDILGKIRKNNPKVNKTTIYRQLESLTKQHILEEVDFQEGQKRYELAHEDHHHHHHHLICTECKMIEHIEVENIEKELSKSSEEFRKLKNFHITSHTLEFFGVCQNCL